MRSSHAYSMKTLVLHTPKGGSGKSTSARELAVSAALAGIVTALVDLDPQGTTTGWYKRRTADTPTLIDLDPTHLQPKLGEIAKAGVQLLVIDTPPATPSWMRSVLAASDIVLVPVRPTPDDLLAAAAIASGLSKHPCWAFLLSQVPPRTRLLASAIRQLAAIGRVAPVQLTFRADFPSAAIDGSAACELAGKAAEETTELWRYVNTLMETI